MKTPSIRFIIPILSGSLLSLLTGCGSGEEPVVPESNSLSELKHSHITIMRFWESSENIDLVRPLNPSVIAWGSDPLEVENLNVFKARMTQNREAGVILQASNAFILTATAKVLHDEPKYQKAVCKDIGGIPIVPPWAEEKYNGVPTYWGCTNHPLFRAQVKERVVDGISSGANMLHIDDHLGTYAASYFAGGCFCEYCMDGFREFLTGRYSKQELLAMGIEDPGSFIYDDLVRATGITSFAQYQEAAGKDRIPLREEFLDFQREAAVAFVQLLGNIADSVAGRDIPVGVNAYNLKPWALPTSRHADYFSNEVQHYGHEDSIPPLAFMLGTALGKPVFATGEGKDWVKAKLDKTVTRVQRWIANAYSFGHYFSYSYNQWGFSPETGTMWYQVPISIYEPLCSFITENADLFDGFEPVAQVALLYDNAACEAGDWRVREVNRDLQFANIPTGLVIQGDKHLQFSTDPEELEKYELLLVPEGTLTSEPANELVKTAGEQGKLVEWTGMDQLATRIDPMVSLTGGEKIWTLPRQKTSPDGTELVIHLLNQDYDPESDSMNEKTDFELFVHKELTGDNTAGNAWIYAPGENPLELEVEQADGGARISVPALDLWAIVSIGSSKDH